MRIHKLTLQAIGPFPGRHEIDLETLSAGGLFLLEGPTGAGKSTVIDAVVFALYGKVAGCDASDDRLHSHFAEPGTEPFVELTFSTAAGCYRVWRSPAFRRPKKRGGGFTPQNARAKLWRLDHPDDDGEPVSAHVQEVATELDEIVVLDRTQFTQTVVLPQGQFASFLRAKPEDRRTVLQDVFGTEIYDRLQKRLAEQARTARAELERSLADVAAAARSFAEASGLDEAEADGTVTDELLVAAEAADTETVTRVAELGCRKARDEADAAETAAKDAASREEAARRCLDGERELAALVVRRSTLLAEKVDLEGLTEVMRADTERLDLARRAGTVMPTVRARRAALARQEAALRSRLILVEQTEDGPDAELAGLESVAQLRAAQDAAGTELGRLSELLELERGLDRRAEQLQTETAALETARADLAHDEAALADRPAARDTLVEALSSLRDAGAEFAEAQALVSAAQDVLEAATACRQREAEEAEARTVLERRAGAAAAAVEAERAVRLRWVAGMAGVLAGSLAGGDPCPVCGSCEHPAPAHTADEHPTAEDVDDATAARERAERDLSDARARHARLAEKVAALRTDSQGLDPAQAAARLSVAEQKKESARAAIHRSAQLEQELADHDRATARLADAIGAARARIAAAAERLAASSARLEEDRGRCAEARGDHGTVAHRVAALTRRAATAQALVDATLECDVATAALAEATAQLAKALEDAGLADAEAANAAYLDDRGCRELDERLSRWRSDLDRVDRGLADPAVAALTGAERPDVEQAEEAHAAALAELRAAAGRATAARGLADRTARAAERLLASLKAHEARARTAAPLARVASLATAGEGNTLDTTLATYVLLRRFEDVVAAANQRLALMSDGRYSLERIDEREGGQRSRRAGLGLQVRDHVTEVCRDPRTLSGGETFYVSLCLALGMADVVRAEAGGIELGTLFVDEGFGSLDPGTLDAVMAELGRLREGGRAVGIVSHVADLKDRIADRIEVRRRADGSSTLTVRS